VPDAPALPGKLLAISDLHVSYPENRRFVEGLRPSSPRDWLLVASDVAEKPADIEWALGTLSRRFGTVIRAIAVVYGHLHIPAVYWHDKVRFEEVSLGYPAEVQAWAARPAAWRRYSRPDPETRVRRS
jgi:predicted phosphodiesterase